MSLQTVPPCTRRLYDARVGSATDQRPLRRLRRTVTTERPCEAIEIAARARASYPSGSVSASGPCPWLVTASAFDAPSGNVPTRSTSSPTWPVAAVAVCRRTLNVGASGTTRSPQAMTTSSGVAASAIARGPGLEQAHGAERDRCG